MNKPDFNQEAHAAELAQLEAQLRSTQAALRNLQRQVYIASRGAGIVPEATTLDQLDFQGLVARLQVLASQPDNGVELNNFELEIAAKGVDIIASVTGDQARKMFSEFQLRSANKFMEMHNAAKSLRTALVKEADARGIDRSVEQIMFGTLSITSETIIVDGDGTRPH